VSVQFSSVQLRRSVRDFTVMKVTADWHELIVHTTVNRHCLR